MTELLTIEGELSDVFTYYDDQGWTDGLPIIPPTEAAVAAALEYTDLDPEDTLGKIPATRAEATVHSVAVNSVMAGCKPEYLPVVIAAVRGLATPDFNAYGIQATTNPVAVLVVVNGPIAEELGFNGKGNCLGHGFRANATVGRAVRLCMINIGGGRPHTTRQRRANQGSTACASPKMRMKPLGSPSMSNAAMTRRPAPYPSSP